MLRLVEARLGLARDPFGPAAAADAIGAGHKFIPLGTRKRRDGIAQPAAGSGGADRLRRAGYVLLLVTKIGGEGEIRTHGTREGYIGFRI